MPDVPSGWLVGDAGISVGDTPARGGRTPAGATWPGDRPEHAAPRSRPNNRRGRHARRPAPRRRKLDRHLPAAAPRVPPDGAPLRPWLVHDRDRRPPPFLRLGHGGQMLHVVPTLNLVIAITSDPTVRSREVGHMAGLQALVAAAVAEGLEARLLSRRAAILGGSWGHIEARPHFFHGPPGGRRKLLCTARISSSAGMRVIRDLPETQGQQSSHSLGKRRFADMCPDPITLSAG